MIEPKSKKYRLLRIIISLLLFGSVGCSESEKSAQQAYERMVFHARTGNEAAFLNGFTEQSQRLIKSLLALRRTYGDFIDADADPYRSLVLDVVESVTLDTEESTDKNTEAVTLNVAILTVTNGDYKRQIRMVEADDGWKIDALQQQEFWAEDRSRRLER
ncbi:MAG: hypothetical protein VX223_03510 [Myxococcota bacterium]|nr:hypothetical protein [Myxococcota bacterium]